jgi:hypothetical protein
VYRLPESIAAAIARMKRINRPSVIFHK